MLWLSLTTKVLQSYAAEPIGKLPPVEPIQRHLLLRHVLFVVAANQHFLLSRDAFILATSFIQFNRKKNISSFEKTLFMVFNIKLLWVANEILSALLISK